MVGHTNNIINVIKVSKNNLVCVKSGSKYLQPASEDGMVADMVVRTKNKVAVRYTILVVDNLTDAMNWRIKPQLCFLTRTRQLIMFVCVDSTMNLRCVFILSGITCALLCLLC